MCEKPMKPKAWLDKYYPISAAELNECCPTELEAVEHCILKWKGLKPKNLAKYGLRMEGLDVIAGSDRKVIVVNGETCALCAKHGKCSSCVLKRIRRGIQCDERISSSTPSPHGHFMQTGDPGPMLKLLKKARKHLKDKAENAEPA